MSKYSDNLFGTVLNASESKVWEQAVTEWEIVDWEEDYFCESSCICGKEEIKYLFTIKNRINGNELYPIGSSCIKKFERNDMREITKLKEEMFRLLHAVEHDEYISLNSDYFSRKLLYALLEDGAFKANIYNDYDGENDYEFMLKMFNKRDKSAITDGQEKKIRAIIVNSIRPYLNEKIADKVRKEQGVR